jgi:putative glutamine amidotransferase
MSRPLVAVPARLAASTSALRYAAAVNARALLTMVHEAGGEPLSVLPWPDGETIDEAVVAERLSFADAVLLPGGGDLDPARYGQEVGSEHVYDVDPLQDAVDLAVARWALSTEVPVLAVCRGLHVVNVALGGTLEQHMEEPHREVVHKEVRHRVGVADPQWPSGLAVQDPLEVSCYHHQRIDRIGDGLVPLAHADDGTVEAVALPGRTGWFLGVQWHPEDMADDPQQQALVRAFVDAARLQLHV